MYYKTENLRDNVKYYEAPKLLDKNNILKLNNLINDDEYEGTKKHLDKIQNNKNNYLNSYIIPKCDCNIILKLLNLQTKKLIESENRYKLWLFIIYLFLMVYK